MMFLNVQVRQVEQVWMVVIEGQARTSFTPCKTEGQAKELAHIVASNPIIAEKLHGKGD